MKRIINGITLGIAIIAAGMPAAAYANRSYVYAECKVGTCKLYLCTEITSPGPLLTGTNEIGTFVFRGPGGTVTSCTEFDSVPDI